MVRVRVRLRGRVRDRVRVRGRGGRLGHCIGSVVAAARVALFPAPKSVRVRIFASHSGQQRNLALVQGCRLSNIRLQAAWFTMVASSATFS